MGKWNFSKDEGGRCPFSDNIYSLDSTYYILYCLTYIPDLFVYFFTVRDNLIDIFIEILPNHIKLKTYFVKSIS